MSGSTKRRSCRNDGLYTRGTPVHEAYRAAVKSEYDIVRRNYRGALRGSNSVYLHDIRVALRRLRIALKFFGKAPGIRKERGLDNGLKKLCSQLGKMRDLQARLEILETLSESGAPGIAQYRKECMKQLKRGIPAMRRTLEGQSWKNCMERLGRIVREKAKGDSETTAAAFCAERLAAAFRKIDEDCFVKPEARNPAGLHECRKRVRKLRYRIELCSPALGKRMKALEKLFKKTTDAFGRIHDIDVIVEMARSSKGMTIPASLKKELASERTRQVRKLRDLLKQVRSEVKGRDMKSYLKGRTA